MNIRQATIDDAKILAELNGHVQQVHADAKPELYKPATLSDEFVAFYKERLQELAEVFYLVEVDGVAVGYVHIVVRERPETFYAHERRDILINEISVNPEYYGSGAADELMQSVVNVAHQHDIKRIVLDVWDWNGRAIGFYNKKGFTTYNHRMELMLE